MICKIVKKKKKKKKVKKRKKDYCRAYVLQESTILIFLLQNVTFNSVS